MAEVIKENIEKAIGIVRNIDYTKMLDIEKMKKGMFVVIGLNDGGEGEEFRIGYIVQVREGAGAFGSNMVFLVHIDGRLITHENQSYCSLSKEDEEIAKNIFSSKSYDKHMNNELYKDCNKIEEAGFIIKNSKSINPNRVDSFAISTF